MSTITDALLAAWDDEEADYKEIRRQRDAFEDVLRADTLDTADPWQHWNSQGANTYNWVTDRVAIGGDDYLINSELALRMKSEGVTHILDCRAESWKTEEVPDGIIYLRNGTGDDGKSKSAEYFRRSIDYGLSALSYPTAKLYVHCAAGINRGPSSGYAVLRASGLSAPVVWGIIRTNRKCAAIEYAYDAELALIELGYSKEVYGL